MVTTLGLAVVALLYNHDDERVVVQINTSVLVVIHILHTTWVQIKIINIKAPCVCHCYPFVDSTN